MESKARKIIIKNVKKSHGGHHGGSWKVAYADFVTAMMAFFLLMWLLAMVSPEKRASLSLYFQQFSLFDKTGKSNMKSGGIKRIVESSSSEESDTNLGEEGKQNGLTTDEIKNLLTQQVTEKLEADKDQIIVDMSRNGVRVQLTDLEGSQIFLPGSALLTERGKRMLSLIAGTARGLPNRIVIEGHTDGTSLKGETTNWELSSARACSARKELEADGINSASIVRVTGFADRAPLIENRPVDPRNRRISIIFLHAQTHKTPPSTNLYDALGRRYH